MKIFSKSMLIVGTIIGAGFASGKEIVWFFSQFNLWGIISSILVFPLLFGLVFFGLNFKAKKWKFFNICFLISSLIFSSAMMAASYFLMSDIFLMSTQVSVIIIAIISSISLKIGIKGIEKISKFVIPILIVILMFVAFNNFKIGGVEFSGESNAFHSLYLGLMYVFSNFILSFYVLQKVGENIEKIDKKKIALISSLIFTIVLVFINLGFLTKSNIINDNMPIFALLTNKSFSKTIKISMLIAVLSTLFSSLQSLKISVESLFFKSGFNFTYLIVSICLLGSFLGFSNIVENAYAIVGIFGVIFVLFQIDIKKIFSCNRKNFCKIKTE